MSDSVIKSNPENKRINFNMIYPFTDKPKIVPILKKTIAVIFFLGCLLWYSTYLTGAYLVSSSLGIDEFFYEIKVEALTTGKIQSVEVVELKGNLINILKKKLFMKSLEKSLFYLLPFLMFFFLYIAFKKEKYEKNIYGVSNFYLILSLFYFVIVGFFLFYKENLFYKDFPLAIEKLEEKDITEKINDQSTGLAISSIYPSFYWIDKVVLNKILIWQLIRAANIVMIVFLFIDIILLILLFVLKPKIDQEKVVKIQQEIRKKAEANLAGKEYQMDPSIF